MTKKTIKDIELKSKKVLVRVDFNLPLDENGGILDDSRIKAALPTIKYLLDQQAAVILCSHLGRPDGKVVEELRMAPIAQRLSELIGKPVQTVKDCVGEEVSRQARSLAQGQILMLENLRFHAEEEENDPDFARALAGLADIYVDDAFGTAHRAHASTAGVARYLPAVAGFLMEKEINTLGAILANPQHPFAAVLGGAKVSDKLGLIANILDKVDALLIGGGMAATFLKVKGINTGSSPVETDKLELTDSMIKEIEKKNITLLLPVDVIVASAIEKTDKGSVVSIDAIPADKRIADIGPATAALFTGELEKARTVFWNGPMGVFEIPQFSNGTKQMVNAMAAGNKVTVVGGGSTAEIVGEMGMVTSMTHVSTGGGASLKFMEGKTLPGVDVLLDK